MTEKLYSKLTIAKIPANNPTSVDELMEADRYTITPIEEEYEGKTATIWNAVYKHFNMKRQMAMMVGNPKEASQILENFRMDQKYIGGGSGVGFKEVNVHHVDELDPLAKAIGAINLIQKLPSGKLKGWNTDGIGFLQGLEKVLEERGVRLAGLKVVILGAGGTGNAIGLTLAEKGAQIVVLNRTIDRAEELAQRINHYVGKMMARAGGEEDIAKEVRNASLIINTSKKGGKGEFENYSSLAKAVLPATPEAIADNMDAAEKIFDVIPRDAILCDVVLRTTPSPFLRRAAERGFITMNGVPMVVNQGVEAFLIIHEKELLGHLNLRQQIYEIMRNAANY